MASVSGQGDALDAGHPETRTGRDRACAPAEQGDFGERAVDGPRRAYPQAAVAAQRQRDLLATYERAKRGRNSGTS